jgi:hypothetical protein
LLFGWLLIATLIVTPLKEAFRSRGVKSRITRLKARLRHLLRALNGKKTFIWRSACPGD